MNGPQGGNGSAWALRQSGCWWYRCWAISPLLGNLLLIVAAVSWALYSVLVKLNAQKYTALAITLVVTAFGIPIIAPVAAIELQTQTIGTITLPVVLGLLYIGIASTAIAFFLWNKSFELLDAATASLFFFAQPVVGALLSAIFLGQTLNWSFIVGGGLILLGALLGMMTPRGAPAQAARVPSNELDD
jgi:drug/metabolite transporter (DMT)-like permease